MCVRWSCRTGLAALALALLPASAMADDVRIASLVDSPDPGAAGGLYRHTMRVDNNAVDAATNTRLSFTVPADAVVVAAAPASQKNWAPVSATAVLSSDNDANPANNTQNATTAVIAGANLGLTKTGTSDLVIGGGTVTHTLRARNAGPNDGGPVVITDNLPPSAGFASASGSGRACSHAGGVVTCNRSGVLAVGGTAPPVTVAGTVHAAGGTMTNRATMAPAAGGVADPDRSDNTATVNTAVVPGADVRIAQKAVTSAQPATAGQNITFQIQPRNSGPANAVHAVVGDVLPAGWTFVAASGPNWACGNAGQAVTCGSASFAAGTLDNITVVATAPDNTVVAPAGRAQTADPSLTPAPTPNLTPSLTPAPERVTDRALSADQQTDVAMQARLRAINAAGRPLRDCFLAKAQCWLDVRFHEYRRNDRGPFPQVALAQALKRHTGVRWAQQKLACAEVERVHAGHEQLQQQWRHARPSVQIAEDLLVEAQALAECCDPPVPPAPPPPPPPPPPPSPLADEAPARATLPPPVLLLPPLRSVRLIASVVFNFDRSGEADLRAFSLAQLQALAQRVQADGLVVRKVQLSGHADRLNGTGQPDHNQRLSARRVATVQALLARLGLAGPDAASITTQALGDGQPVQACAGPFAAPADRQECLLPNRRVDVLITADPARR